MLHLFLDNFFVKPESKNFSYFYQNINLIVFFFYQKNNIGELFINGKKKPIVGYIYQEPLHSPKFHCFLCLEETQIRVFQQVKCTLGPIVRNL